MLSFNSCFLDYWAYPNNGDYPGEIRLVVTFKLSLIWGSYLQVVKLDNKLVVILMLLVSRLLFQAATLDNRLVVTMLFSLWARLLLQAVTLDNRLVVTLMLSLLPGFLTSCYLGQQVSCYLNVELVTRLLFEAATLDNRLVVTLMISLIAGFSYKLLPWISGYLLPWC